MSRSTTRQIPKLTLRVWHYLPMLLVLGLAVHLLLPQITALEHSLQVIRQMALWAVGLAILAQVGSYLGSGYMLRTLVKVAGQQFTLLRATVITTAAASVGLVAGGMVGNAAATYRWMRASGVNQEGALLTGWLPSFFNNALLWLVSLVGVLHLLFVHDLTTVQSMGFAFTALILGMAVGVVLWGVGHRLQLVAVAENLSRRWAVLRHKAYDSAPVHDATEQLFTMWDTLRAGGWRGPLLGAALNVIGDMLTLYFFFIAAGHTVSPGVLLAGYGLPLLLGKMAFFLPGGVGLVEGTMTALYTGLGVPDAVTIVVILAYRATSFWLPSLIGFPMAAHLQRTVHSSG